MMSKQHKLQGYSQAYCFPLCSWLTISVMLLVEIGVDLSRHIVYLDIAIFLCLMEVDCHILRHEILEGLVLGLMGLVDGSPQCITSTFV